MAAERWLGAVWPIVRGSLPAPPARVLEIGCGPHGGFVPKLSSSGYDVIGVDPEAPEGVEYRRSQCEHADVQKLSSSGYDVIGVDPEAPEGVEYRRSQFEHADVQSDFDVVVASTSLHHVVDPAAVIGRIASVLADAGIVVVVEWAWEDFDEATARWCFARLGPSEDAGWLHRRRDDWLASGQEWEAHLRSWAERERVHRSAALLRLLDRSFDRQHLSRGAYVFPDLAGTSEEDELAAIERGEIRATRVDYVGRVRR